MSNLVGFVEQFHRCGEIRSKHTTRGIEVFVISADPKNSSVIKTIVSANGNFAKLRKFTNYGRVLTDISYI